MITTENILARLCELKPKTKANTRFYISVMDFETNKMVSNFSSSRIDDVVQYLFDKSLTTSIMTIQYVGRNEIGIILQNESDCKTNINDVVIESIIGFGK